MRDFCWLCHRPLAGCFCKNVRSFASPVDFALIVHPYEVKSTVGTAWILRRSISNLKWIRSNGLDLDSDPDFLEMISTPVFTPLLLFPGSQVFNLTERSNEDWQTLVPASSRPLFIVIDATWSQARAVLRRSSVLRSLPRVTFKTPQPSEYEFKKQPHMDCLSSVEGVHHVMEMMAARGWARLPEFREHDQMIEVFKTMVKRQKAMSADTDYSAQYSHRHNQSQYAQTQTLSESDQ